MTIPFRSVAEAQAFASAFSKAASDVKGSTRLSLNSTLHCLAVAYKFKNWPTMKAHLNKQAEVGLGSACGFAELPPLGVMEVATLFGEGRELGHYTYTSSLPSRRIQALRFAVLSAKRVDLDVIVVARDMDTLYAAGLDFDPLFLGTPPSLLWRADNPIALGYFYKPEQARGLTEDPLGLFLAYLQDLQKDRLQSSRDKGDRDARGIHLLLEPHPQGSCSSNELGFHEQAADEISLIAYAGRRLKISIGYFYDDSLDFLNPENNRLTRSILANSSSNHKD